MAGRAEGRAVRDGWGFGVLSEGILIAITSALATVILAAIVGGILISRHFNIKPKNLKLPFVEFETSRFGDLSPVKLFENVSKILIIPSESAEKWLTRPRVEIAPVMLMHIGWQIVSKAFVSQYLAYPNEKNVQAHVGTLGSQNAEFVTLFGKLYRDAIRNEESVEIEFAREYFLRAPSLAMRIHASVDYEEDELFKLLSQILPTPGR
ncbi:MAG: hypothetical protein QUV08_05340 [Parasphingorhabdus sp.]|nr:hypothetical protein [Parasphingorhabdus sp.]